MLSSRFVQLSVPLCQAAQLSLICIRHAAMNRPLHVCCRLLSRGWATLQISSCAASPCSCSCAPSTWWRACSHGLFGCVDIDPDRMLTVPAGLQSRVVKAFPKM